MKNELMQLLKVFVVACLAAALTYGGSIVTFGATEWRAVAAAGVAAVLVVLYRYAASIKVTSLATDLVLVFSVSVLGQLVAFGTHVLNLGAGEWKAVLTAAIAATVYAAFNWLSPTHVAYGVVKN